ncbi:MAG: glycosyltransferase [Ferruginibacter sp.]
MDKHLHIISFDVPYPADYGGVIDVFYKIVSLYEAGIKINLHCFTKDRPAQNELNKYCVSVNYYKRQKAFSLTTPYIVQSRADKALLANLQKDDHPILMEGIHCTYLLGKGLLKNRKTFVRLHNTEHKYYASLAKEEKNILKKIYFKRESFLLKKYEAGLAPKTIFAALSKDDKEFYETHFLAKHVYFIPAFLPWNNVAKISGEGQYCLYHGNLAINENQKAICWLLENVFNDIEIPFVIAGSNPSKKLQEFAEKNSNVCMVANPSERELQDLIVKAQINILPSFNNTGVKLKLLNALFNGRYCLVNTAAVKGSGLEDLCKIAETGKDFKQQIQQIFKQEFSAIDPDKRTQILQQFYNNADNAEALISLLY